MDSQPKKNHHAIDPFDRIILYRNAVSIPKQATMLTPVLSKSPWPIGSLSKFYFNYPPLPSPHLCQSEFDWIEFSSWSWLTSTWTIYTWIELSSGGASHAKMINVMDNRWMETSAEPQLMSRHRPTNLLTQYQVIKSANCAADTNFQNQSPNFKWFWHRRLTLALNRFDVDFAGFMHAMAYKEIL